MAKIRVKKTGEVLDFAPKSLVCGERDGEDAEFPIEEVDVISDNDDYWEKLRHKYAGMAMPKCIDVVSQIIWKDGNIQEETIAKQVAVMSVQYADALIEELKK